MAGILDFLNSPWSPYGTDAGLTNADQVGLLGRALAGFGAGLNSGPRGLVNQGGVLTMMPSNNWGGGFSGMSDAYSQGMNDLTRRVLTGSQMKTAELNRQKSQYELDQARQQQAARDEFTAAMQSGDPARIAATRAKFDPQGAYQQGYGWQKAPGQIDQERSDLGYRTNEQIRASREARVDTPAEVAQKEKMLRLQASLSTSNLTDDMKELGQINAERRAANQPPMTMEQLFRAKRGADPGAVADTRAKMAEQYGLKPGSPQHQAFVLTGKMPREDQQPLTPTDKKAIMEADEGVMAAETAIASLNRAKALSKEAYSGPMAGTRGYVSSQWGSRAGEATTDLTNETTTNALSQLKSIFGAAPTEGERAILLEIQGSVNQPDAVRQKIFDRAIILAERRLDFNRRRANELRGGTFYKTKESANSADGNAAPDPLNIRGRP